MLKKILIPALFLALAASMAEAKECKDCTEGNPCTISLPAGDGCNTCAAEVWCNDETWYVGGVSSCTLLSCPKPIASIKNPNFSDDADLEEIEEE